MNHYNFKATFFSFTEIPGPVLPVVLRQLPFISSSVPSTSHVRACKIILKA